MLSLILLAILSLDDKIQQSEAHLVTKSSECSGTLIAPGVVLTARHCVGEAFDYVEIGGPDTSYKLFGKVIKSKNADLALVMVPDATRDPVANLATQPPHRGDDFRLIGLSFDVPWALSKGFVMSAYPADIRYHKDPRTYHVTALSCMGCDEGDSGAGVFNDQGELEGVFVASSENNVRTYMVPLAEVKKFLHGAGY